jgi:GT2 family glycosyltransferase
MMGDVDILMITYNRPRYTRLSIARLLETCDDSSRVWLWHNGTDADTLAVVRTYLDHPRVHDFHHSPENRALWEPTNWVLEHAQGSLIGKVDDDCLMPQGWIERMRAAHYEGLRFGVLGSWPFLESDLQPRLVKKRTRVLSGQAVMESAWVGGAGFMMKRACKDRCGLLQPNETFPHYCMRVARAGWVNGWPIPFILMDHMDDPRSTHTVFRSDQDVERHRGLVATQRDIRTLEQFHNRVKEAAIELQTASPDWRDHIGLRARIRRVIRKLFR